MSARPGGFTLLELLAAVAILGLLLVILTQGVHFGLLATQSEARIGDENAGLQEVDLALRHLIEATNPGSEEQDQPSLLGRRNTMTFVTEVPGLAELPGNRRNDGSDRGNAICRWPASIDAALAPDVTPDSRGTTTTGERNRIAMLCLAHGVVVLATNGGLGRRMAVLGIAGDGEDPFGVIQPPVARLARHCRCSAVGSTMSATQRDQRGFALLVVLWTVTLLALLGTYLVVAARERTAMTSDLRIAATMESAADGARRNTPSLELLKGQWTPGRNHSLARYVRRHGGCQDFPGG